MAGNPFHDEHGRFCSKDEMYGAVQRLHREGKHEEANTLFLEYKTATEAAKKEALTAGNLRDLVNAASTPPVTVQKKPAVKVTGEGIYRTREQAETAAQKLQLGLQQLTITEDQEPIDFHQQRDFENFVETYGRYYQHHPEEVGIDKFDGDHRGQPIHRFPNKDGRTAVAFIQNNRLWVSDPEPHVDFYEQPTGPFPNIYQVSTTPAIVEATSTPTYKADPQPSHAMKKATKEWVELRTGGDQYAEPAGAIVMPSLSDNPNVTVYKDPSTRILYRRTVGTPGPHFSGASWEQVREADLVTGPKVIFERLT